LKGVFEMNRNQANSTEVTFNESSRQVSSQILSDGIDEEFSKELAAHGDLISKREINKAKLNKKK